MAYHHPSVPTADPLQFYQSSYAQPYASNTPPSGPGASMMATGGPAGTMGTMGNMGSMGRMGPGPGAGHPYGVPPPPPNGIEVNWRVAFTSGGFDGEPPLLEELGINFGHIWDKAFTALNPFRPIQRNLMDDTDLAGPLLFCLLFGIFLLMSGKVHFSYIYGLGAIGCLSMYAILNLMSERGVDGAITVSVLGYCLLPMVLLSVIIGVLQLTATIKLVLSCLSVCWCTYSASTMFVTVLGMNEQRLLVAYPVGLLYAIFALMTIF